jgi:hypothetical protein
VFVPTANALEAATSHVESCWQRRQWASGSAINPVKLVAEQQAKQRYTDDVLVSYAPYCDTADGCRLSYDQRTSPFCTRAGPNWQCHVSGEVFCRRTVEEL